MSIPLIEDIKSDRRWWRNVLKITAFIVLCFILDFSISSLLLTGVERNYGLKGDAEILMTGHSHLMLAVDKVLLEKETGEKVAKYTREGVNMADRRVMLDHYYSECTGQPGTVILGIDPWLFTGEDLSRNSYKLFLPFMDSPAIRDYVRMSDSSRIDYLKARWIRTSRYNATLLNASLRGWLHNWDNLKIGVVDSVRVMNRLAEGNFRPVAFNSNLMNEFALTLKSLAEKNVRVILLNTPVWKPVADDKRNDFKKAMCLIDSIAKAQCPDAEIIDLMPLFSDRTELFYDAIHMNPEGQKEVTEVVARYLKCEDDTKQGEGSNK